MRQPPPAGRRRLALGVARPTNQHWGPVSAGLTPRRPRLLSLFFKEEMELSLIGLNAAGKTSLVNVIAVRGVKGCWEPARAAGLRLG